MSDKETFELYGGEVRLEFSPSSHRYMVSENGGKPFRSTSITTVLNTLAKANLVDWGVRLACDFMEAGMTNLLAGESISPQEVLRLIQQARTAHDNARDEAAGLGNLSHAWLEAYWGAKVQRINTPDLPEHPQVNKFVTDVVRWFDEHEVEPLYIEKPVYSRKYKIAGRGDKFAVIDGNLAVVDYKSGRNIYPESALQTAGYAKFYEEETGVPVIDRWILGRKDGEEFLPKHYPPEDLEADYAAFLGTFTAYNRLKELRRKPKKNKNELSENWLEELG